MSIEIGKGGLSVSWIADKLKAQITVLKDGCAMLGACADDGVIRALSTDTRTVCPGEIFLALHGERFDAHDYIEESLLRGVYCVICEHIPESAVHGRFIVVPDTGKALLSLASAYKDELSPTVTVAITGSVGKTTTKELVYALFSQKYNTIKTEKNYNNTIGLPFTLFHIAPEHEAAVLEMGMDAPGEISAMSRAARPDIAVITNIGTSHIGLLGSREAIRDAKLEIADGLADGGLLIYNGDEPLLAGVRGDRVSALDPDAPVYLHNITEEGGNTYFDLSLRGKLLRGLMIPALGAHVAFDAALACAAADTAGLTEEEIRRGLSGFSNTGSRQKIYQKNGITVIDDCYNASAESIKASLGVLRSVADGGRTVAVLGDMLELGEKSAVLHRSVGEEVARLGTDLLFTYGDDALEYARGAEGVTSRSFSRDGDGLRGICESLRQTLLPGDTVLFKASRSVAIEKVIQGVFE